MDGACECESELDREVLGWQLRFTLGRATTRQQESGGDYDNDCQTTPHLRSPSSSNLRALSGCSVPDRGLRGRYTAARGGNTLRLLSCNPLKCSRRHESRCQSLPVGLAHW